MGQKVEVSRALVLHVLALFAFNVFARPVNIALPLFILFFVVIIAAKAKVIFLCCFLAILHGGGKRLEETDDALEEARPAWLNGDGDLVTGEDDEGCDGCNAELLVVDAGEAVDAGEPQAEKLVGPAVRFQHLEGQAGVVVESVDDHLHEVDAVALDLDIVVCEDSHGERDKLGHVIVNVAAKVEHEGFGELAAADAVDASDLVVLEDCADHVDNGSQVLRVLDESIPAVVDKVLESREHVFEVELGTRLEGGVDELKGAPHGGRDDLGGKGAAVDNLKDFIVEIVELVLQSDGDDGHENGLEVCQDVGCALKGQDEGANGLQDTEGSDALVVEEVAVVILVLGLVALDEFPHDAHIRVAKLLAKGNGKGGELGSKDLDEVLHDVGKRVDIDLVGQLEELLHDLGDVLLHRDADDVVTDQWLQSQGGLDTDR